MEAYLSLVTVLIMCVPGLVFIIKMWQKKKKARQARELGTLPIREQRSWPVTWPRDAILHSLATQHHHFRKEELLASQITAYCSMPYLGCIDNVSHPYRQVR